MIEFLTTPIFYLTPYIILWSVLDGFIVAWLLGRLRMPVAAGAQVAAGAATAAASLLWNWMIEFTQATIYLNVDHPVFRVSWADTLNAVCAYALTAFVLGTFTNQRDAAGVVARIAAVAALVTLVTDTFLF